MSSYVAELENRVQLLSAQVSQQHPHPHPHPHAPSSVASDIRSPPGTRNALASPASTDNHYMQRPNTRVTQSNKTDDQAETGADSADDDDVEVNGVNAHTRNTEFHGPTSSMAFLSALQSSKPSPSSSHHTPRVLAAKQSIVSDFHNNAFSPSQPDFSSGAEFASFEAERYHFRQAHLFLDGYFNNLHFVHPILDRANFLARCEDLWFGRSDRQSGTFVALYYSVMSLGALVREWERQELDGLGRFQWSRKLFQHALQALDWFRFPNDIETVQCLIFLAKVCQNELNPQLAYIFLGWASRNSLSAGHNRRLRRRTPDEEQTDSSDIISRLWWGLYSLEIEMSFSLGRPDSLGLDDYHNQAVPTINGSETDIIGLMIPFAQVVRKVSVFIYLSGSSVRDQTSKAFGLEQQLDQWFASLPEKLRPDPGVGQNTLRLMKDPEWARRQRIVLELRHLNVKMILFRPFLICATRNTRQGTPALDTAVSKCVQAAKSSIDLMHTTFCKQSYFRTWWYNTTYILYAASIILCHASRTTPNATSNKHSLLGFIDMTLEVLEVMDESVVARKAAELIRRTLTQIREQGRSPNGGIVKPFTLPEQQSATTPEALTDFNYDGLHIQMPDLSMDPDLDFINASMPFDYGQIPTWGNFIDSIGEFRP